MDILVSESESEVYESAEESLDDNEERSKGNSLKKSKTFSNPELEVEKSEENEEAKFTNNDFYSGERSSDNAFVTYRKRPKKVSRSSGNPFPKNTKKKSSPKEFFKSDIAPDIFIDLTANFSKNINKSLNTIQQKSSCVKDFLKNSLPLANATEKDAFTYDENNPNLCNAMDGDVSVNQAICDDHDSSKVINSEDSKFEKNESEVIKQSEIVNLKTDIDVESNCNVSKGSDNNITVKNEYVIADDYDKELGSEHENDDKNQREHETLSCNVSESDEGIIISDINSALKQNKHMQSNLKYTSPQINAENNMQPPTESEIHSFESGNFITSINSSEYNKISKTLESSTTDLQSDNFCESNSKNNRIQAKESLVKCIVDNINEFNLSKENKEETENDLNSEKISPFKDNVEVTVEDCSCLNFGSKSISSQKEFPPEYYSVSNTKKTGNEKVYTEADSHNPASLKNFNSSNYIDSSFINNEGPINFNIDGATKSVINEDFNTSDLKSAIKEIMSEKGSNLNMPSEELTVASVQDGWDDFDFSDCENESIEDHNEVSLNKIKNGEISKHLKENMSKLQGDYSFETLNVVCNEDLKNLSSRSNDNIEVESLHKFEFSKIPKSNEYFSEKVEADVIQKGPIDDWGWDEWGDDVGCKEYSPEISNLAESTESLKTENDLKMWSGWDTFGQKQEEKASKWGSWGVNMLLNKASAVTQGISTVIEAGLGAPDPESLVQIEKLEKIRNKESNTGMESTNVKCGDLSPDVNLFPTFGITNLVAGVTSKIVEHSKIQEIGSKVITGGLDTLESFGKKTMEMLQEGDPGLRNKRAILLGSTKPVLSQVLKEARDKADKEMREFEEKEMQKKCHFEGLFDDFQGLVHLEALEMLSKQCELKLDQIKNSISSEDIEDLVNVLEEVEQLCSLDDYGLGVNDSPLSFNKALLNAIKPLKEEISVQKILEIQQNVEEWLQQSTGKPLSAAIIEQKLVSTLAQLTAAIVNQFHKTGALLIVKECRKTVEEIDALSEMTNILIKEIINICGNFIALTKDSLKGVDKLNLLIGRIDVVMENSISHIRQAFNLLIPILQVGAAV